MKELLSKVWDKLLFKKSVPLKKAIDKDLKPINYNKTIIEELEKQIELFLFNLLFKKIRDILKEYNAFMNDIANSEEDIIRAIKEGKITYENGRFKSNFKNGKFPISISKTLSEMGASYNPNTKSFQINGALNKETQEAIKTSIMDNFSFKKKLEEAIAFSGTQVAFEELFKKKAFEDVYANIMKDTITQIKSNSFEIPISLNPEQEKLVAINYTNNLKLTIKNFTDEETLKLRELVEEYTQAGFRPQALADEIEKRFDVSRSKAKFLADQETRLLTTAYAQAKFTENNISTKFRWGSSASKVQDPFHQEYYNKVFSYDNLPVINEQTGEIGLPGQRYGCKCRIIPIISELEKVN
jgi:hypothetical protein